MKQDVVERGPSKLKDHVASPHARVAVEWLSRLVFHDFLPEYALYEGAGNLGGRRTLRVRNGGWDRPTQQPDLRGDSKGNHSLHTKPRASSDYHYRYRETERDTGSDEKRDNKSCLGAETRPINLTFLRETAPISRIDGHAARDVEYDFETFPYYSRLPQLPLSTSSSARSLPMGMASGHDNHCTIP
ncbi:hypothetical protein K491DRAFT_683113 [Lophiostoma macrostomum CBS 122681]|uniref:Uncharacterized protein n=1 Tax=Lophiostoma macrostomum CBS 122681 TaxID=1314788 RepID=A0A6A6SR17_9PLEO|nr:hypothetical protein K491DRAFT_683113 [Lophiostoma macrostomum CBS 122681]